MYFDGLSVAEQILVGYHHHPSHMVFKFVIVRIHREKADGSGHLHEAVADELESFVILAHASLEMDLLSFMLFRIVGIFGDGL